MQFRLIVTRPNGSQFQSSTVPLPDRDAAGMSALKALAAAKVSFGRNGLALGREIRDAELGATVAHEPSGYRFRTEEW